MFKFLSFRVLLALLVLAILVESGPLAYGICQSGCNALVVACYASAGATFGTITAGASTPAVILGCNAALGVCMSGCVAAGFTPSLQFLDKNFFRPRRSSENLSLRFTYTNKFMLAEIKLINN